MTHEFRHPKYYAALRKERKPQDNNASFEGISEAEYNKRHMKALKDADPGLKHQATKASSLKPSVKRLAKRLA